MVKMSDKGILFAAALGAALLFPQAGFSATSPEVNEAYFAEKVYPMLETAGCPICHNDNGVGSPTRMHFPPQDAEAIAIQAFGLKLAVLVDYDDPEQSLLLNKPTLRLPHTGGERLAKESAEEQVLKSWVDYLAGLSEVKLSESLAELEKNRQLTIKSSVVRRLTHSQYNNTVSDLLGDFTRPADQFPSEDFLDGFKNRAEAQTIPPLLAEAYMNAAEKLAINVFRQGDSQGLVPCKPASAEDAACRDEFIRTFGLKAFRRPLTEQEVLGYSDLFGWAAVEKGDFLAGAKVVVEGMLQSPSFLFHLEAGPNVKWAQHETASRLSYFLWDTMPGDELFRAAQAGELSSVEEVEKWARKMLDHPRARRSMEGFLAQWMRFDRVIASVRNPRVYPDFSASLLPVMTEETKHLFNYLVWQDKNFMEMFNADYSFLSARLAKHYGLEAPPQEFGMVKYSAYSTRAGVLGHAGFLTLTSPPSDTSPTARGLFVREQLLCQKVPPPPPGVDANLPPVRADKPMTNRERLQIHLSNKACASCHGLTDPIGLGLEHFDNVGRYREKQVLNIRPEGGSRRDRKVFELEIDSKAHIPGIPGSEFFTLKGLGEILADDIRCQRCVVKLIFRYALGRHENVADQTYIDGTFDVFRNSGFRFRELLVALVKSKPFLGDRFPAAAVEQSGGS